MPLVLREQTQDIVRRFAFGVESLNELLGAIGEKVFDAGEGELAAGRKQIGKRRAHQLCINADLEQMTAEDEREVVLNLKAAFFSGKGRRAVGAGKRAGSDALWIKDDDADRIRAGFIARQQP